MEEFMDPTYMIVGSLVSLFGAAYLAWGRNLGNIIIKAIGIVLMILPMLVTNPLPMSLIAIVLVVYGFRMR